MDGCSSRPLVMPFLILYSNFLYCVLATMYEEQQVFTKWSADRVIETVCVYGATALGEHNELLVVIHDAQSVKAMA